MNMAYKTDKNSPEANKLKAGINLGELTNQATDLLKLTEIPASDLNDGAFASANYED